MSCGSARYEPRGCGALVAETRRLWNLDARVRHSHNLTFYDDGVFTY